MAASAPDAQPTPTPKADKPSAKIDFDPKAAETMFSALTRRMNLWQQIVFNPTIDPAVRNRFYEELLFLYSAMLELSSDQPKGAFWRAARPSGNSNTSSSTSTRK